MIELKNVSFGFDENSAVLRNLSLSIRPGEKVCLLGLNGSGKSTLLKLCAGLLKPTSGEVLIRGKDTREPQNRSEDSRAGFIFQNPDDQIVGSTVAEDIAFALQNLRTPRVELMERVERAARDFNLIHKMTSTPEELSAGEKQRLALAGVLITDPALLLIDEPTSYLDTEGKVQLRKVIKSTSATVLAATQFIEEVDDFDKVIFLKEGMVAFNGSPAEFRSSDFAPRTLNILRRNSADTTTILLEAQGITFCHDESAPILTNFSHQFKSGVISAIMGSSGSGKTTLALLLAGLLKPGKGNVVIDKNYKVGLLLQFPEHSFFSETVFDEVAFAARNQALPEDRVRQRVRESLSQVGLDLDDLSLRSPFTLSAGEQRRVAIASVLVMDCDVYIFDELTCGLDWEGRQAMAGMLADLSRSGKCVIISGHDRELADAIQAEVVRLE